MAEVVDYSLEPPRAVAKAPGRQYELRGKTETLELTEKDIVKQLVHLVNEKKNSELVGHCEKVLKNQLNHEITAAIENVREKLLKKQAAVLRK